MEIPASSDIPNCSCNSVTAISNPDCLQGISAFSWPSPRTRHVAFACLPLRPAGNRCGHAKRTHCLLVRASSNTGILSSSCGAGSPCAKGIQTDWPASLLERVPCQTWDPLLLPPPLIAVKAGTLCPRFNSVTPTSTLQPECENHLRLDI